ncbi:MAG: CoA transferase [Alphaproteobacteria bacterium]|nr:CoA transferase [Alphaproteobacteria bacterium]MBU1514320.1 CoA transferase [Alphaproteobacteria bacterium]MBU2095964.1 CoA transferase [Alphaproteobacteria bacterium]MBU2153062.1 CoA transferase [Alphaproteobacteria bacterium]MBU2308519.1 CoA transferase [Alphaproteobacteria bacterium]
MSPIQGVLDRLHGRVSDLTARIGRRVDVPALGISDRSGQLALDPPARISPNRACRMVRAADGWIAVNLARDEDRDLIPAWLHGEIEDDAWAQVERLAPTRTQAELMDGAMLLGLPACAVGEARCESPEPIVAIEGPPLVRRAGQPLKVVDLSALWAGPMCGAILAAMGAEVVRVESIGRPDPTRVTMPAFFNRLNGAKTDIAVDLADPEQRAWLREDVMSADVVISSARARGLASLGLSPREKLTAVPGGVWAAITGYGWHAAPDRVAFGDDAAAAGGLVRWTATGEPNFLGDALADPLTGLAAAIGILEALGRRGGRLVAASLAYSAAGAAFEAGLRRAA